MVKTIRRFAPLALFSIALLACHAKEGRAEPSSSPSSSTRVSSASIDTSKLRLVPGRAGLEDTGFVHVYGEVINETGQPIEAVTVHVDLLDARGKSLDVGGWLSVHKKEIGAPAGETARGDVHYVPAGGSTPFHYVRDTKKIQGTYASHKLSVTARPVNGPLPTAQIDAPSTEKGQGNLVMLKGSFKVTGSLACRSPKALFGFYDGSGKLLDIEEPHQDALDAYFQKELTPGQVVAFEGKSYPEGGTGATMKTWASCAFVNPKKK